MASQADARSKAFIVVGGAASGVLTAVHILRRFRDARVTLFEKRPDLGSGIAYGTEQPHHLLNVPASGMSAFADDPGHFLDWLSTYGTWRPEGGWTPRSFVPRRIYRDYLASLIAPFLDEPDRLQVHRDEVVALSESEAGVTVRTAAGMAFSADAAVLATGNEGAPLPPAAWRHECWATPARFDIPAGAAVGIIGTGLSMVDAVLSLLDAGHAGPILAISRRGLLPHPQAPTTPCLFEETDLPFGQPLSSMALWLRRQVRRSAAEQGKDWREFVDGLRPWTQHLWRQLPHAEKRRFLRHARPWWDIHRHRMAPEIRARIDAAVASGRLTLVSGSILGLAPEGGRVVLRYRPRGSRKELTAAIDAVIECRGSNTDVAATRNPLLRSLLESGTIRADALKLGIDVTPEGAVIRRDGTPSRRIHAIGPATLGTFWEIVAVPDIRLHAARLAVRLNAGPD